MELPKEGRGAGCQNRVAGGRRKSVRLYINVIEKTDTTPQSFTYAVASGKILPVPG